MALAHSFQLYLPLFNCQAADKLDSLGLSPDLVVLSPLSRAADTGMAFLKRHPELEEVTEVNEGGKESERDDEVEGELNFDFRRR